MARQFNVQTAAELEQAGNFCDTLMACAKAREQGNLEWTRHYLSGEYPPHYPVPTIQLEVDITPDHTTIWSTTDGGYNENCVYTCFRV